MAPCGIDARVGNAAIWTDFNGTPLLDCKQWIDCLYVSRRRELIIMKTICRPSLRMLRELTLTHFKCMYKSRRIFGGRAELPYSLWKYSLRYKQTKTEDDIRQEFQLNKHSKLIWKYWNDFQNSRTVVEEISILKIITASCDPTPSIVSRFINFPRSLCTMENYNSVCGSSFNRYFQMDLINSADKTSLTTFDIARKLQINNCCLRLQTRSTISGPFNSTPTKYTLK